MFGNFAKSDRFYREIQSKKKELMEGIDNKNQSSCLCCTVCCWVRPCNLAEGDIEKIAEFLKITPKELFKKYLCVDDAGASLYVFQFFL